MLRKTYADLIKYETSEIQMSIPALRCCGWTKLPRSFYITDKIFSPYHFSIRPNQFIHDENRVCPSETSEHLFTTTRCRNPKEFHHMKCHLLTVAFHVLGKLQETKNLSRVEKDLYVLGICKVFLCLLDMANI